MESILTEEKVTSLREWFKEIDVDDNGTITTKEMFNELYKKIWWLGPEIFGIVATADTNGDGVINFEECLQFDSEG